MAATQSSLIENIHQGPCSARWDEYLQRYQPLILNALRQFGVPRHEREDVLQDVLVRILQTSSRFHYRRNQGSYRAWLRCLTRRQVIDRYRRNGCRIQPQPLNDFGPLVDDRDSHPDRRENLLDLMSQAIAQTQTEVRPRTWKCFESHVLEGRAATEVARDVGVSPNAVFVNSSRVMSRIREICVRQEVSGDDRAPSMSH